MAHTACLVCLVSSVSGCHKNVLGRDIASSGHITKLRSCLADWGSPCSQKSVFLCLQEHLEKIAVTMGKEHLSRSELCNDPAIIKDLVKKLTRCQML